MCFFIQSCEPLGGGKKERKKMHIPLWASCPTCLPFLPPLCTPQLTETCQWPTCMCWQPTSHHGFFPALTCWDRGEVLPLKLPWEPALTCAAGASPSGLCAIPTSPPSHNSPPRVPSPEHLPGLGSWQIFLQQLQKVISHQLPAGSLFSPPRVSTHMQTGHCCLVWRCLVRKEQVHPFGISPAQVALSLPYSSARSFSWVRKGAAGWGASPGGLTHGQAMEGGALGHQTPRGRKKGLARLKFIDKQIYIL